MEMKIRVGVFFGGKSVEHEISVISAIQSIDAFDRSVYDVVPVYIAKDGHMYAGEKVGKIESYRDIKRMLQKSVRVIPAKDGDRIKLVRDKAGPLKSPVYDWFDVAFPVVHGAGVEDGTLQGYFKSLSCPFVGCDVLSSALGMDKATQKTVLQKAGVPVLECVTAGRREFYLSREDVLARIENACAYPLIVKPVNLGSSIGIKRANDKKALLSALEYAFEFSDRVLAERAIVRLKEINCAVLGDCDSAVSSECEEPINYDEILSFADKYLSGGTTGAKGGGMADAKRKLPADIPAEQKKTIQDCALKTFHALGCAGVSRIDFLHDMDSGEIFVNEINTIPGSLCFYLWEASGIPFSDLLDRLVNLAFKREREQAEITRSFQTNILQDFSFGKGSKGKA